MSYLIIIKLTLYGCHSLSYSVISAEALTPVGSHTGPCQLVFEKKSITIKGRSSSELGVWPYDVIRRFFCHDLVYFTFTSGRRGPFGVQDYKFRVQEHDLVALQKVLAQYTGGPMFASVSDYNYDHFWKKLFRSISIDRC